MKKILITGSAGFIGFHLVKRLIDEKYDIVGIDILNNYYDVKLKFSRLSELGINKNKISLNKLTNSKLYPNLRFINADIANVEFMKIFMSKEKFNYVVNLAAQAGVRYSLKNPFAYTESNITGFLNILEGSRHNKVEHLIYASTSSVYGLNTKMPLKEVNSADHPISFYAATKKSNEMMAHSYSHLFKIPSTGLRFFTVYGPWGRPDMALFLFTDAIIKGKPLNVFNNGKMVRDFTYVDDIVESIKKLIQKPPKSNDKWNNSIPLPNSSSAPFQIFNIGNSNPTQLMDYINAIENKIGKKALINFMPMQAGDVPKTHANTKSLENYIKFKPSTSIKSGIEKFINWYIKYFKIKN